MKKVKSKKKREQKWWLNAWLVESHFYFYFFLHLRVSHKGLLFLPTWRPIAHLDLAFSHSSRRMAPMFELHGTTWHAWCHLHAFILFFFSCFVWLNFSYLLQVSFPRPARVPCNHPSMPHASTPQPTYFLISHAPGQPHNTNRFLHSSRSQTSHLLSASYAMDFPHAQLVMPIAPRLERSCHSPSC